MQALTILPSYIHWHYTRALRDSVRIWVNILWFVEHFFSVRLLLRTLFSPWRRIVEERKDGFDMEDIIGTIVVNIFSRIVGAFIRIPIIIFGLCALMLTVVLGVVFYMCWFFAPALPLGLVFFGVFLML